jgi:TRAP-type C4-dicarboxylate transport system permease small subunit
MGRVVPGILLVLGVFGWGGWELARMAVAAWKPAELGLPQMPLDLVRPLGQAAWVGVALGASLLSWLLARRLAGRGGMV